MNSGKQSILVTGAAGFIAYHLCERLLRGRPRGSRLRQPQRLLRRFPQAGAVGAIAGAERLSISRSWIWPIDLAWSGCSRSALPRAWCIWPLRLACATR